MTAAAPASNSAEALLFASSKALEAAQELLRASRGQSFDPNASLQLMMEAMGAILIAMPMARLPKVDVHTLIMDADFGWGTPEAIKGKAGLQ